MSRIELAKYRIEKARKELNWKPQYSDLKTIIQTAWTWHRKHS